MLEALCRSSGTTLDIRMSRDGPPITQRTSGLSGSLRLFYNTLNRMWLQSCPIGFPPAIATSRPPSPAPRHPDPPLKMPRRIGSQPLRMAPAHLREEPYWPLSSPLTRSTSLAWSDRQIVRPTSVRFIGLRVPRRAIAPLVSGLDDTPIRIVPRGTEALDLLLVYASGENLTEGSRRNPWFPLHRGVFRRSQLLDFIH